MTSPIDLLAQTLAARDRLRKSERSRLEALPVRPQEFRRGETIVEVGSRANESCLLGSGFAGRTTYLRSGSRQLSAVHIPGDFVDLHVFLLKVIDHSIVALTDCSVLFVRHTELRKLIEEEPHLGRMLWLLTTIDAAIERAWIACLGRLSAGAHLAHLICELYVRLDLIGMVEDRAFIFPITQGDISDMLGISPVHTNRIVQSLRREKMIEWANGRIKLLDFDTLADFGEFHPRFLNLIQEPR
jgi:CRP-like cAMP-binding protein